MHGMIARARTLTDAAAIDACLNEIEEEGIN